jgi:hypothetical protein
MHLAFDCLPGKQVRKQAASFLFGIRIGIDSNIALKFIPAIPHCQERRVSYGAGIREWKIILTSKTT